MDIYPYKDIWSSKERMPNCDFWKRDKWKLYVFVSREIIPYMYDRNKWELSPIIFFNKFLLERSILLFRKRLVKKRKKKEAQILDWWSVDFTFLEKSESTYNYLLTLSDEENDIIIETTNCLLRNHIRKNIWINKCYRELSKEDLKMIPYDQYLQTDHRQRMKYNTKKKCWWRCVVCNSKDKLDCHHRSYSNRWNEEEEIKDLFLLCRSCHILFHKNNPERK